MRFCTWVLTTIVLLGFTPSAAAQVTVYTDRDAVLQALGSQEAALASESFDGLADGKITVFPYDAGFGPRREAQRPQR
jgi:hypothetical protein